MDIIKARQELSLGKSIFDMKLRVVDLNRVSTDKEEQLNSLSNQVNYFTDLIDSVKNWTHVATYSDEGISGTQTYNREEFLKMIFDAKLGKFDLILTKEVSRFARNTVDSINYTKMLLNYGVIVYFISDNINTLDPDSEFRLTLMASLAQDEIRKLSQRVKFGVQRSIKDGKVGGGGLYGYDKRDGKLTIREDEAIVVKKIFSLYSAGKLGFRKIGEKLAEEGIYTRKGKIFSDVTLKKMITNPRYKGWYTGNLSGVVDYLTHKKKAKPKEEWVVHPDKTGSVPAIVSEELWNRVNDIYKERLKVANKNVLNKEEYLKNSTYTSKLFCLEHNTTFIRTANGKRKENPVWQCNEYLRHGIKGCATPILYEKHLNEIFSNILDNFIDNKDELLNTIEKDYINIIKETNKNYDVDELKAKILEEEKMKDRLLDMSLRKIISEEEYINKKEKIDNDLEQLKEELIKIESNTDSSDYYANIIENIRNEIKPKMNVKENVNTYFNLFIDKVFVSKIDNDRKHIKLQIVFKFNKNDMELELNLNRNNNNGSGGSIDQLLDNITNKGSNRDYTFKLSVDSKYLKQKYLLLDANESRFCSIGSKTGH